MSFDSRSRERLEALGRQLPKPLPLPEPAKASGRSDGPRHPVELEQDPEQLFRELMVASADGNVPPHLLERLRQLEESRRRQVRLTVEGDRPSSESGQAPKAPARSRHNWLANARPRNPEQESLYTAFQQLLLEDDDLT